MRRLFYVLLCILALGGTALADVPQVTRKVGLDQHLGQAVPLDLPFVDENGGHVRLDQYFHKRPVIMVMSWYQCPGLCSEVQTGIVQSLLDLPLDAGKDFQVVNVSIDPDEGPDLARPKKELAVQRYGRPGAAAGLHYLTGKEPDIEKLCQALGFRYVYDPHTKQYAHTAGIIVVTPEGKISRYLYGVRYSSNTLRLALEDASHNRIGTLADKLYLLCFRYDPASGKYGLAIMRLLRFSGFVMVGGLGMFVWRYRHV